MDGVKPPSVEASRKAKIMAPDSLYKCGIGIGNSTRPQNDTGNHFQAPALHNPSIHICAHA